MEAFSDENEKRITQYLKMKFNLFSLIAVLGIFFGGLAPRAVAQTPPRTYLVDWSFDGVQYETLVQLRGQSGLMRVRFVDPLSGSLRLIQMVARLEYDGAYYILSGKFARNAYTGRREPDYLPDYLWFSSAPRGTQAVFTVDQYGRRTYGESRELRQGTEVAKAKHAFAWKPSKASQSPQLERRRQLREERRARDLMNDLKWLNNKDGLELAR